MSENENLLYLQNILIGKNDNDNFFFGQSISIEVNS